MDRWRNNQVKENKKIKRFLLIFFQRQHFQHDFRFKNRLAGLFNIQLSAEEVRVTNNLINE